MSAADFGLTRRPRGRHVVLQYEERAEEWRPALETPDERAGRVYERLLQHLATVSAQDVVRVELRNEFRNGELVVCGEPACAGDDGSGRWVNYRGRCPKCAGYAMTLGQIAKHRESVICGEGERAE